MATLEEYLKASRGRWEAALMDLLRIPSVSADPRHRGDCRRAAEWVAARLAEMGLAVEQIETGGNPIVYAESSPVPGAPVVLVYGHYDVQPADLRDGWTAPPFEPVIRDGKVFARGATDDKGQMLTHLLSAEAWLATEGRLPLQLKFLIEGEEEIGSPALFRLLESERAAQFACDAVVISDMSQYGPGQPAVTYGLRGIAVFELRLAGPRTDLHSGSFGGAVTNPANALVQMLAGLVDEKGRIAVPGFYDDVAPLSDRERGLLASLPFDSRAFMEKLGVAGLSGEAGYSTNERRWARPSLDINGLTAGYQGEGSKTVLPARATAKFSFRLVPRQQPGRIAAAVRAHLERLCPPGIAMELIDQHGSPGLLVDVNSPAVQAAVAAIERGFGRSPVLIREGGSVPIVAAFAERLTENLLLLGWGQPDDNAHGPDEKFSLSDFHQAIKASAHLWRTLSRIGPQGA